MMPKTGCLSWPMSCAILMVLCLGNPCGLGQDSPGVQDSLEAIDRSVDALKKNPEGLRGISSETKKDPRRLFENGGDFT